ncbi:MAG: MBOAT family protein [Lachnospiraceae bacterium]|nr:MBOAT family protein [Lachnospiraceae bacterium]
MLFSSIPFLFYFLPVVLICYFAVPRVAKNVVLFLASLVFYAWGEPRFVIVMLASILIGYLSGIFIEKAKSKNTKKLFLCIGTVLCLAGLAYFKYVDFFITAFNSATKLSVPLLKVALPIGISFYSFQIISYLVDVYRGDTAAQKNFIKLGAYIAMFPQLIAGPIVRYSDIEKQLTDRKQNFEQVAEGIKRFIIGLSKKILIANVLGEFVDKFRAIQEPTVGFYWIYAVVFSLHLYFDFSGYSDMAIGIGKILGFTFPENFNYPFISGSVTEFWRRWHMSLGSWFRDYVYIPLGGNRVSKIKWVRNILIVWALTGFWHGADWTFIIWGLMFALLLMLEKTPFGKLLKKCKPLAHVYLLAAIILSFVIFNANGLGQMAADFKGLFGGAGIPGWNEQTGYYLRSYAVVIAMAAVGATPLPKLLVNKIFKNKENKTVNVIYSVAEVVFVLGLLIVCTSFLVDGSFNPFLYFRF